MHSGKEFIPLCMYCLGMLGHTEYVEVFSPPTAFCDFSVIFHQIFLIFCQYEENQLCISCIHFCVWRSKVKFTFGWLVVLDKGTTCYKFWGHRLKVKVMRKQPRKISCTLFFLLYYNMYNEFLWNFSSPYASCPPVCNLWLGFVTLTMNSIIMLREMFHKHIWNFRIQIKI